MSKYRCPTDLVQKVADGMISPNTAGVERMARDLIDARALLAAKDEARWKSLTQPPEHHDLVLVRTTEPHNNERQFAVLAYYKNSKWRAVDGSALSTEWPSVSLVWTDIPHLKESPHA